MMWLIVGDDLGEFVDALDQDGKERRVTVLALRKMCIRDSVKAPGQRVPFSIYAPFSE